MTEEKKKRKDSEFTLFEIVENNNPIEDGGGTTTYMPITTGATDRELMAEALERGDGQYAIANIRRSFPVSTKTERVIG